MIPFICRNSLWLKVSISSNISRATPVSIDYYLLQIPLSQSFTFKSRVSSYLRWVSCIQYTVEFYTFVLPATVWMFVFPPNSHVGIPMPSVKVLEEVGIWEVIKSYEGSPGERDQCYYLRPQRTFQPFPPHEGTVRHLQPGREPSTNHANLQPLWSWTSSLKYGSVVDSHPVYGML